MPYIQPAPGNEVVISGISGRYPRCRNMAELKEKIMDKQNLVGPTTRWPIGFLNLPPNFGEMSDTEKFDSVFFGINMKQAIAMDPSGRMLLEYAYEAIVDAGCNPAEFRGKNIAVIVGACHNESENIMMDDQEKSVRGYAITGSSKAMLSNRISYWLGVHGPSYTIDTACSSSGSALDICYRMIVNGECDGAIVAGCNISFRPIITLNFLNLGVLSPNGHCRPFDVDANGYVRSDATCVIFIQRAKDAKRIYTTVVHCKTNNDGYKPNGITFPSHKLQAELLRDFYDECKIKPSSLNYLEAHATGTKVGDPEEIQAIDAALCTGRTTPLKVGSIKSNLGHTEPVSGLCSICKVIIAMETGIIPPNINYNRPNDSLTAIIEGRLQVVTEKTPWELGYAAVNNFGFGGTNAHVLLKSNPKEKVNNGAPNDDLSRVVVVSGRTETAVNVLLDSVENAGFDAEYIRLLHDVYIYNIPKHPYRGYTIVGPKHTTIKTREVIPYNEDIRPVCFVFSGMGSQWPGMGKMLMRYPLFAEAIKKCDAVLKPRGIDILHIISTNDKTIFNNILNCFIGIAAVQIGLMDLLTAAGIVPDKIIGHSVGELGCAYADGCFTAEQMILAAYARGLASIETDLIDGAMAAVGLGAEQVKKMCPADIDVACHNSSTSSTISGPSASIRKFVAELQDKKVFVKEVATSNIAYHSRYIANAGPKLLTYLREIIPKPKARSEKWLSSSVPQKYWSTEATKYSSAEYHTNNLLSAVLFEETAKLIPKNAICIEIAPHGLLQAILTRSLGSKTTHVPLTLRGHKDNAEFLAQALGKLYNVGLQPKVANIYPPVSLPVSRGTPMISPNIKWDHSDDFYLSEFDPRAKTASGERILDITTKDSSFQFMSGHVIDGRNLIPATGYLWLVWETLALMNSVAMTKLSVVFEDTRFHRATTIANGNTGKKLTVLINQGTGDFGILEQATAVVTGKVRVTTNPASEMATTDFLPQLLGEEDLDSQDFYKELRIRGYEYEGLFQSVKSAAFDGTKGHITWHDNYAAFLDNMLQFKILTLQKKSLYVPTNIRKLIINVEAHEEMAVSMQDDKKDFPVYSYKNLDLIVSGGLQIFGMTGRSISRRKLDGIPVLEEHKFVAHRDRGQVSMEEMVIMTCQLALEIQPVVKFKTLEVVDPQNDTAPEDLVSCMLLRILRDIPLVEPVTYLSAAERKYQNVSLPSEIQIIKSSNLPQNESILLGVGQNLLTKENEPVLKDILSSLRPGGLIMTTEDLMSDITLHRASDSSLNIIMEKCNGTKTVLLLRKQLKKPEKLAVVSVTSKGLDWMEKIKGIMKSTLEQEINRQLILVTQTDKECGILGMVKCLMKEPGGEIVRAMIIEDENTPTFRPDHPLYAQQLQMDLPINILKDGAWGSYRHLPLPPQKLKPTYHAYVDQLEQSDLSSLRWAEGPVKPTDNPEDQIHIVYAALNFKDIMLATGRIPEEVIVQAKNTTGTHSLLGFEYSGLKANGERVMGLKSVTGISNLYYPESCMIWKIKDQWSLEDAATIPGVYVTACYALYIVDNIKKGEKILIHSGTGGVGQAAIHLALQDGLEVFTTVGTPDKRRFIREKFPSIPDDHIGNSRDTSFEYMIMEQTNGRGVDIVLNSLTEDKLLASVRCLARDGRFLEIGKYDIAANNTLSMLLFLKEISFRSIMLDATLADSSGKRALALTAKIQDFLDRDRIQPISRKVFDKEEVESAIRYMSSGKHIGKVLIKLYDENGPYNEPILSHPRFYCTKSGSYVIVGGLGGLGLEVAEWLCSRGARNLILISRRGITTSYQKYKIHQWRADGINVEVIMDRKCWERKDCEYVLMAAAKLGPVDAIFNLAVQLKDALFMNQSVENFEESLRPKVGITRQLDQLSRTLCPELRYFVVFSSVVCGRGNIGQTNYGYGNAVMERICERRVAEGLPGLAIEWGAVGEVGLVADMQKNNKAINIAGTLPQKVSSCMQELERFLLQSHPVVCSMVTAEKRRGPGTAENPLQAVVQLMGIKTTDSANMDTPLVDLGMDSILAADVKETLEREFDVFLTAMEIRNLNIRKLYELSNEKNDAKRVRERGGTTTGATENGLDILWGAGNFLHMMTMAAQNTADCVDYPVASHDSEAKVFLIPGISGSCVVFAPLISQLKYSATCIQSPQSSEYKTIEALAEYFLPHITEKLSGVSKIILVGYSLGVLVTIEIARRLEYLGHKLRLILIDATPLTLPLLLNTLDLKLNSESLLHARVLLLICQLISSTASEYGPLFEQIENLSERVDFAISKINFSSVPAEYQKALCMGVYSRLCACIVYEFDELLPLKSPITFLKATKGLSQLINVRHGLEKVTTGTIEDIAITGDHTTILRNNEVANIINSSMVNT